VALDCTEVFCALTAGSVCSATRDGLHRHMHAALGLAHAHLTRSPGEGPSMGGGGRGLGGVGDVMDNARVTFMELVGCAVVENRAFLHVSLVSEHVEKVLMAVPHLVNLRAPTALPQGRWALHLPGVDLGVASSASSASTASQHTSLLRGNMRLVAACRQVCLLEEAITHRSFQLVIAALSPIMELLSALRDEGPEAEELHAAVASCFATAIQTLRKRSPANQALSLAMSVMLPVQRFANNACEIDRRRATNLLQQMVQEATSSTSSASTPDGAAASSNPCKPCAEEWGNAQLAKITAFFIPRLADPARTVRLSARRAIACLHRLVSPEAPPEPPQEPLPAGDAPGEVACMEEEAAQTASAAVRKVLPAMRCLITAEGLVGAVEQLLLATGEDSQATSAQAAAAALSLLLAPQQSEHAGGTARAAACISAGAAGILTRAVLCIGANAPRESQQHQAATACVSDLAHQHPQEVVNVVLTADLTENSNSKCALIRRFGVCSLISAAADPLLGGAVLKHLCELLLNAAVPTPGVDFEMVGKGGGYTSFKDFDVSSPVAFFPWGAAPGGRGSLNRRRRPSGVRRPSKS